MSEKKNSNPKHALGIRKAPIHAVPFSVISEIGLAMMEGGMKYGTHNYRHDGVRASTYVDAVWRHLFQQWWDQGEDLDADSFLSHVTKAIACLVVLRDSMLFGNFIDDRPIKQKNHLPSLNAAASKLVDKFPTPVEGFTQLHKLKEEVEEPGLEPRTDRPDDEDTDWVLTDMFQEAGNPDFMVICKKDNDWMTPDKLKRIEAIMSEPVKEKEIPTSDDGSDDPTEVPNLAPDSPVSDFQLPPDRLDSETALDLLKATQAPSSEYEARMRQQEAHNYINRFVDDMLAKANGGQVFRKLSKQALLDGFRPECGDCCLEQHCKEVSFEAYLNKKWRGNHDV
jgi:hypothetical protein